MAYHAVLMGDSVFDNGAYTDGAPDVAGHLRTALGDTWTVTALAIDGATTTDVYPQRDQIPADATRLCLSLGGNDALANADLLATQVDSTAQALDLFATRLSAFEASYHRVLQALSHPARPLLVCTIYEGDLADQGPRAATALRMFNDVIIRAAATFKADVLDLRCICNDPSHFVNGIEPSGPAGGNIAHALAHALRDGPPHSRLFGAVGP